MCHGCVRLRTPQFGAAVRSWTPKRRKFWASPDSLSGCSCRKRTIGGSGPDPPYFRERGADHDESRSPRPRGSPKAMRGRRLSSMFGTRERARPDPRSRAGAPGKSVASRHAVCPRVPLPTGSCSVRPPPPTSFRCRWARAWGSLGPEARPCGHTAAANRPRRRARTAEGHCRTRSIRFQRRHRKESFIWVCRM